MACTTLQLCGPGSEQSQGVARTSIAERHHRAKASHAPAWQSGTTEARPKRSTIDLAVTQSSIAHLQQLVARAALQ